MPLPLNNLDDRRWADLVDEGRALIPRYAPAWTDHNVHDPGVTLIELFAWLTEMAIYRLNRVPPRHRRKFLALLGLTPAPPRAARVVLTFSPDAGTASFDLPAGVLFDAIGRDAQPVVFSTTRDFNVCDVALVALLTDEGSKTIQDRCADWRDGLEVHAFGENPTPGAALYLGFSRLPTEQPVALAVRLAGPGSDVEERVRIIREAAEQREACRAALPDLHCEDEISPEPRRDFLPPHHSARVVWEVFTGAAANPWQTLESIEMPARPKPGQVVDDTRSLTLDGLVEVSVPASVVETDLQGVAAKLFYLRCRLVAAGYDAPPILIDVASNSVLAEQAVPMSKQLTIAKGATVTGSAPATFPVVTCLDMKIDSDGAIGQLKFHPAGTAGKPHVTVLSYSPPGASAGQICLEMVPVGVGTGLPLLPIELANAPLLIDDLRLYTHAGVDWQEWKRRDDFDASTRTDAHFVADAMTGEVRFGDGERGRVPAAGDRIFAVYRRTRAALGNIEAKTVSAPSDNPRNDALLSTLSAAEVDQLRNDDAKNPSRVTNRAPATGGAAQEALAGTIGRAVETLHAHERLIDLTRAGRTETLDQLEKDTVLRIRPPTNAVNLLDVERLALQVPGTRVARAHACAAVHPDYPCLFAAGVVTVVIVPDMPVPRPEPAPGLLETVKKYLDRRRMVATRLAVVGPRYLAVHVDAWVQPATGADSSRVRDGVVAALTALLDPRTGGPNGLGWPFGRDVSRAEILQAIAAVHGVDSVARLSLRGGAGEALCGDLPLCPTWLVTPGTLQVHIGAPPAEKRSTPPGLSPCPTPESREPIP